MKKRYPFKFLDSYTQEDSDIFFGREEDTDTLYEMVFQTDLLLVYGASGTGKTSLIQCGLANKFHSYDWLPLLIRRGNNINESFEKILRETGNGNAKVGETETLSWQNKTTINDDGITMVAARPISKIAQSLKVIYRKHFKPVYLIFDQFEELYVLGDKKEQRKFIQTVKEILRIEQPIKIIIAIREEYLGYLYEIEQEVPELFSKKLRVEAMNLEKVKIVLNGINSYEQSNVHLKNGEEEELAERIFKKIKDDKKRIIQLPYLQVFLDKLYLKITGDKKREAEAEFSLTALNKIGNLVDVLRDFLDEQVLEVATDFKQSPETIWKILSPFVSLEGTKEPTKEEDLIARLSDLDSDLIQKTLAAFVNNRVLRYTEKEKRYEVSHDSLAKQIHAKRSEEEIAILEVQRLIKSQSVLKEEAKEFFTEKQLLFIAPYLDKFKLEEKEQAWINKSKEQIKKVKAEEEEERTKELADAKTRAEKEAKLRANADEQKQIAELSEKKAKKWTRFASIVLLIAIVLGGWGWISQRSAANSLEALKTTTKISKAEELKLYGDSYSDLKKDIVAKETYEEAWKILTNPSDKETIQLDLDSLKARTKKLRNELEKKLRSTNNPPKQ